MVLHFNILRFVLDGIVPVYQDGWSSTQTAELHSMLDYHVVGAVEVTQVRKVTKFPIPVKLVYKDQEQHGVEVSMESYSCSGAMYYV